MSPEERYALASRRAEQQKAAFFSSAAAAKARVAPARLKQDVKDKALNRLMVTSDNVTTAAKERPFAVGAAASAFALYLFRRPLSALFRRMYVRITNRNPEESETDDG